MLIHEAGRLTRSGVLDVGLKCSHSCRFCYYSFLDNSPDQFRGIRKAKFRSAGECMDILRLLHDSGIDRFDYTGGEPSLHPDIVAITEFAHRELGIKGRMITLGQYLMQKMKNCRGKHLLGDLLDAGISNFLFSIHAADENLFRDLTGGSFKKLRSAMNHLDDLNFSYTGNTAVCSLNMKRLPEIARELLKHNVYMHNFIVMNAYYEWSKNGKGLGVQARYSEILPHLKEAVNLLEGHGVAVNIRYAPLCTVMGMERNLVGIVGVRYDPYEWRNLGGHFGGTPEDCARFVPVIEGQAEDAFRFAKLRGKAGSTGIIGMRGNHLKYFSDRCGTCSAIHICDGIDPNYLKAYGDEELVPYEDIGSSGALATVRKDYRAAFIVKTEQFENMKMHVKEAFDERNVPGPIDIRTDNSEPAVSVVVTCYNYGRYLEEAVRSVASQTLKDIEIIIVDDGSTDNSREVAERLVSEIGSHRIRLINQNNSGQPAISRNRGISEATGRYILCLDADDLLHPEMISECMRVLDTRPDAAIAYTDRRDFDGVDQIVNAGEYNFQRLRYANHISYCALFRREVWESVGGYRENVRGMEDWDFWIAAGIRGFTGCRIPKPLFLYRRHDTGVYQDALEDSKSIYANIVMNNKEAYDKNDIKKARAVIADEEKGGDSKNPMVSVIVPTFNRPDMLTRAIRSVLNQTFRDFEIIVVNDDGADVENVISCLNSDGNIAYVRHGRRMDRAAARNTALKIARGKYIAYLDDDDIYYPEHLETLVSYLQKSDHAVAYTDAFRSIVEEKNGEYVSVKKDIPYSYDFNRRNLMVSNFMPILCIMHEKRCIDNAGMFDENLATHEDWDLWIRIAREHSFVHIKKPTCEFTWRQDGTSTTSHLKDDFQRTRKVIYGRYSDDVAGDAEVLRAQSETLMRYEPGNDRTSEEGLKAEVSTLVNEGRIKEAYKILAQHISDDEAGGDLIALFCGLARECGRLEDSKNALDEYLSLHMADLEALCRYAEICIELGEDEEALNAVERVLIFDAGNENALSLREEIKRQKELLAE